ncbi:putative bifunctional diguanylate cyclase/phosphodiesterase [Polycladidibacter hongkongensis]|uniref:putative bifunctional diguanylate cyclase/phosphodiesterase n=1 Tax=Polycladidibacter hongkongensis TaxID=1647556 RepID=UPI00082ACD4E|nr:bifunctional diguanylate cyclase/phosphodiesterase [Pseudovibrio hongkongensis]
MALYSADGDNANFPFLQGETPETRAKSRRRMSRILALVLLLVVLSALAVATLALFWSTEQALNHEIAKERRLVSSYLAVYRNSLANEVERIAVSDKAYDAIIADKTRLFLDQDLTPTMNNRGDRDVFIILDGARKPIYTFRQDLPWHADIFSQQLGYQLQGVFDDLDRAAKRRDEQLYVPGPLRSKAPDAITIKDILKLDDGFGLATVSAIIPSTRREDAAPVLAGYLVWVRLLDTRALKDFSDSTGLQQIAIGEAPEIGVTQVAGLPLTDRNGRIISHVTWRTSASSGTIFTRAAPYLLGTFLVIIAATLLLLRRSIGLTDELLGNEAQATHAALHDALTGLPNRTYFSWSALKLLRRTRMNDQLSALVYLDLDHFKQINDSLGHSVGDEVIKEVARRLRRTCQREDLVARVSGDEFLLLIFGRSSKDQFDELLQAIEHAISEEIEVEGQKIFTTASLGLTICPEHGNELQELMRRADIALYSAKNNGRGRYSEFHLEMENSVIMSKQLEEEIKKALGRGEFVNYYQPIMDGAGENIVGAEALIRWNHPRRGLIAPASFLPVAEGTQLINLIGEWVLDNAIQDALDLPGGKMCVNISPSQLGLPDFPQLIKSLCEKYKVDPAVLELEVTEEILMNYTESTGKILNDLQEMGVSIALDDFGTGFSNLNYLRKHRFNKIKIDRTFLSDIENDKDAREIVRSLINLGQSIGMAVCIEGVETAEQYHVLKDMGAEILQGFLFSKPVPLAKFKLWHEDYSAPHTLYPQEHEPRRATVEA